MEVGCARDVLDGEYEFAGLATDVGGGMRPTRRTPQKSVRVEPAVAGAQVDVVDRGRDPKRAVNGPRRVARAHAWVNPPPQLHQRRDRVDEHHSVTAVAV